MPILGLPATMALLVTLAAGAQRAPSPEEQQAFVQGLRLYDAGDARGAERAWKAGYAVAHDPAFLVRIAEAEEKAGAPLEALQKYQQYLRESPDAADRADIEARVNRLQGKGPEPKAEIEVETPGQMKGAPVGGAAAGAEPGYAPAATGTAIAPASKRTPTAAAASAPPPRVPSPQVRDDTQDDPTPLFGEGANRSTLNTTAWIGVGVTTLLLGVAAFFGASAADKAGDANRLLTFRDPDTGMPQEYATLADQYEEDVRVGRRDDRIAKGVLLAAGVTAVASTILFIVDGSKSAQGETRALARRTRCPAHVAGVATANSNSARLGLSWNF